MSYIVELLHKLQFSVDLCCQETWANLQEEFEIFLKNLLVGIVIKGKQSFSKLNDL